ACRRSVGPLSLEPSASTPLASIFAPSGIATRHWPTELKFSSAKPGGSMTRWHPEQAGFCRCSSSWSRTDFVADSLPLLLSSRVGTFGGGGVGGVFRNVVSTYAPRKTGDVRVARPVSDRILPWPSRPNRFGSVSFT